MKPLTIAHLILNGLLVTNCWLCGVADGNTFRNKRSDFIEEYDFIVVGGGTAGCTVASRLSENGNFSVLLIEAGGVPHPGLDIPALAPKYHRETNAVKEYPSVPQKKAGLRNGGVISYLEGRALGGSSSVNGMMFNRGSPYDYDNWAETTGDPSWGYSNLLKYFKKIEDYKGEFPSDSQHGKGGPITVSQPKYIPGLSEWLQAGRFLGYPVADPNGPQKVSFNPAEYSKKFGRRVSSYSGYIKPVLENTPQLKIIMESVVNRVQFDGTRATGVVYTTTGVEGQNYVRARREVILSAGPIASPGILMKSGVGPEDVLRSAGIYPVKHLPVGQNFQDHTTVPLNFIVNNRSVVFIPERDLNPQTLEVYNKFGDGPYSAYVVHLQAFIATSVATSPPTSGAYHGTWEWPDVHLMYGQNTLATSGLNYEDLGATKLEAAVASLVLLTRPKSVGRVTLNLTDPLNSDPLIDFNYYSHPDDIAGVMEGIETMLKIFEKTPAFQVLGVRYPSVPLPACQNVPFRSEEYWLCYMRQRTTSGLHGAGSCKMGRDSDDPTAVVDTQLKVIGLEGLRVADNSIMPHVTNANTQAAAYVIGEKAADMILGQNETI